MKKFILIISVLSIFLFTSCAQATLIEETEKQENEKQETELVEVDLSLDFSTKEDAWTNSKGVGSRASVAGSNLTHIALKVFDSNNTAVLDTIQAKTDLGNKFGVLNDLRIPVGTYTFVIVAHKAATEVNPKPVTINSPTEAIIHEKNLYETYATVKESVKISTFESSSIELNLKLMVAQLIFKVMDEITLETAKIRATVNADASEEESLICNPSTGVFTTDAAFSKTWEIPEDLEDRKGKTFAVIVGLTDYSIGMNLKLEALDSNDEVIYSRTFTDIELNRAKKKTLSTNLYIVNTETTIELEEWGDNENITIP